MRKESVCLQEGLYQFAIHDSNGDGICCGYGEGSYNVTIYGKVIVQGGVFGTKETTTFAIPFDETTVFATTITSAPMTSPPPVVTRPTPFPTESGTLYAMDTSADFYAVSN